uniref:Uncharacterized protein n=1 Tax=Graphocephala atropunctata TaxID=36148 RepID=A0A1B6MKQ5_9HEMI
MKRSSRIPQKLKSGPRGFFSEVHCPIDCSPCFHSRSEKGLRAGVHLPAPLGTCPQVSTKHLHYFDDILCMVSSLDCEFQKLEDLFHSRKSQNERPTKGIRRVINSVDDMNYLNHANSLLRLKHNLKQELISHVKVMERRGYNNIGDTDSVLTTLEDKLFSLLRRLEGFKTQLVGEPYSKKCFRSTPSVGFGKRTNTHKRRLASPQSGLYRAAFSECEFCSYCDSFKKVCDCKSQPWRTSREFQSHHDYRHRQIIHQSDCIFKVPFCERNKVGDGLSYNKSKPRDTDKFKNSFKKNSCFQRNDSNGRCTFQKFKDRYNHSRGNGKIPIPTFTEDEVEKVSCDIKRGKNELTKGMHLPSLNNENNSNMKKRRNRAGKDGKSRGKVKQFVVLKRKSSSEDKDNRIRSKTHMKSGKSRNIGKDNHSSTESNTEMESVQSNESLEYPKDEAKPLHRRTIRRKTKGKVTLNNSKRKNSVVSVGSSHDTRNIGDESESSGNVSNRGKARKRRTKRGRSYKKTPSKQRQRSQRRSNFRNVKQNSDGFRIEYSKNKPITIKPRSQRRRHTFLVKHSSSDELDRDVWYLNKKLPKRTKEDKRNSSLIMVDDDEPNHLFCSDYFKRRTRNRVPRVSQNPCVPPIPCVPQVCCIPQIPCIPHIPCFPQVPCVPQIHCVPQISCVPQTPCVSKNPCLPQTQCVLNPPCIQQSPCVSRSRLYPFCDTPSLDKVPTNLNISKYFERVVGPREDICLQPYRLVPTCSSGQLECVFESMYTPSSTSIKTQREGVLSFDVSSSESSVCKICPPKNEEEMVYTTTSKSKILRRHAIEGRVIATEKTRRKKKKTEENNC